MMVVATTMFCLGGILAGGAGIFLLLALGDLRALWTLRRTSVTPVTARGRVAVEGVTEYGTAGPQLAPVTGADCAWYRVTLLREPSRGDAGADHDVLLEITSPSWAALEDASGRVPVDPRLLDHPRTLRDPGQNEPSVSITTEIEHRPAQRARLPRIVPPDVVRDLRRSEHLRLTEVRVPRGAKVFALGRATPTGLLPNRAGLTLLTTDSRAEVIAARRDAIGTGGRLALWFGLIGLLLTAGSAAWLSTMG
ncbi:hypothetical protein AB0F72_20100 [Actinoplanes sp. NPDC023936]|uniref:hypothetical protein n=1 Tax=Actinoplanes sp. NPDC023936 TaxID=3154910 RepID=UPI0033D41C0C